MKTIDQIKQRAKTAKLLAGKATKGPWSYDLDENEIHSDSRIDSGGDPAHICEMLNPNKLNNAVLIEQSRTLVPELSSDVLMLLKEVELLRSVLHEYSQALPPNAISMMLSRALAASKERLG